MIPRLYLAAGGVVLWAASLAFVSARAYDHGKDVVEGRHAAAELARQEALAEYGIDSAARARAALGREATDEVQIVRVTDKLQTVIREPGRVEYRNVCVTDDGVRSLNDLIGLANYRPGVVPAALPSPAPTDGQDGSGPDSEAR